MAPKTAVPDPTYWRNSGYNYQIMLAYISPADYMRLAMQEFGHRWYDIEDWKLDMTPSYVKKFRAAMLNGWPIEVPFLTLTDAVITKSVPFRGYVDAGVGIVAADPRVHQTGHEGRNRARIAYDLGIKEIPVRFWIVGMKNWDSYEKIWNRPDIEKQILINLGVRNGRVVRVG